MYRAERIVFWLIALVATSLPAWWCCLWFLPSSRPFFKPSHWPDTALLDFWLADVFLWLLMLMALFAIHSVQRQPAYRDRMQWIVWTLALVSAYPTLYCLAISLRSGESWIASTLMASLTGLLLSCATIVGFPGQQSATFREINLPPTAALASTLFQVCIFWGLFLGIIPQGVAECEVHILENALPNSSVAWPLQQTVFVTLFVPASCLGLWSAFTMAYRGRGTPLPTALPPRLVAQGPYRFIRNPMALAGVLQGLGVGYLLGSFAVLAGSLVAGFFWNACVRPAEEADLAQRFGASFVQYRDRVGIWIPKRAKPTDLDPRPEN